MKPTYVGSSVRRIHGMDYKGKEAISNEICFFKAIRKYNSLNVYYEINHIITSRKFFRTFFIKVTDLTGSSAAFVIAFAAIVIWAAVEPVFNFSENWQLVINTGTTIVTFLMVFLIQKSQNKDSLEI